MVNSSIVQPVEVSIAERIDLGTIPLNALRQRTIQLLSALLNNKKIFKSEEGYCRDWRGLFQVLSLQNHYVTELENHVNPTRRVIDLWQEAAREAKSSPNLKELQNILGFIDRWDVLDSSSKLFYEDAEAFLTQRQKIMNREAESEKQKQNLDECGSDEDIITIDDSHNHKQFYDAFVLFADADVEFATKIIERLEERKLKICVKDRDLLAGISFEHEAIIRLISERCRRLVVVISKEFLRSPLNEFFVTFAQALQIEQKKRKIIPCVYERLELPANLKFYFILDYKRSNKLYNFWDKLMDAIKVKGESPSVQFRSETNPVGSVIVPEHKNDVNTPARLITEQSLVANDEKLEVKFAVSSEVNTQQSAKKSHSSWDITNTFKLRSKPKPAHSSTSELASKSEDRELEQKKQKWYSKFGLSSEDRKAIDGSADNPKKKKNKWYKTNKKIATAL
ncbi:myeloid differentiation primary response protein MyD88 [Topomyia yanbarensis]|uniref:myeloid differentiation primary response protein MyD88 n=1 Tax=Topomyia yanbarensis TaxID=2498891 RepID=UPI00273C7EB7|nr:myeloid differentiation primary response protein MyD88 [Topomyia yanbarensis]